MPISLEQLNQYCNQSTKHIQEDSKLHVSLHTNKYCNRLSFIIPQHNVVLTYYNIHLYLVTTDKCHLEIITTCYPRRYPGLIQPSMWLHSSHKSASGNLLRIRSIYTFKPSFIKVALLHVCCHICLWNSRRSPSLKFQKQILIQCYTLHMKHACIHLDILCTDRVRPVLSCFCDFTYDFI